MSNKNTYSLAPFESDLTSLDPLNFWDRDFYEPKHKKKKKRKRKKNKKKAKKQARREFGYHLLDKATDTVCDIAKLYFSNKFSSN